MAQKTVLELMEDISAEVNGDASAPSVGSDEYNLFLKALNRAERTWAGLDYDWEMLRKVHQTTASQSGTSVGLPSGFMKLSGFVLVDGEPYTEIRPQDVPLHSGDSEYVVVNRPEQYLTISPARPTTVSVSIPYQSAATSLATSSAVPQCPSDEYLVAKASSLILFGRSDGRYSELRDEAEQLLQQLVGQEVSKLQQFDSTIKMREIDNKSFVIGVD